MSSNEAVSTVSSADEIDPIFELIKENKVNESIAYVNENKLKLVDCVDRNGTTPLQYVNKSDKIHFKYLLLIIIKFKGCFQRQL